VPVVRKHLTDEIVCSEKTDLFSCYSEQLSTDLFIILGNPLTILKNSSSMLNYRIGIKAKGALLSDSEVDACEDM